MRQTDPLDYEIARNRRDRLLEEATVDAAGLAEVESRIAAIAARIDATPGGWEMLRESNEGGSESEWDGWRRETDHLFAVEG